MFKIEADVSRSVDSQREELLEIIKCKQKLYKDYSSIENILLAKNKNIVEFKLQQWDYENLLLIQNFTYQKYQNVTKYSSILKNIKQEIIEDYKRSMKYSYVLLKQHETLYLYRQNVAKEFPILQIRAPVPYHQLKVISEHFMQHNLFITNEVLRNIQQLWFNKYHTMLIVNIADFGILPLPSSEVEKQFNFLCNKSKQYFLHDYLFTVAAEVSKKLNGSSHYERDIKNNRAVNKKFFRSVNAILSRQLRDVVTNTLQHIYTFFQQYAYGNEFDGKYNDLMFPCIPFITIGATLHEKQLQCTPQIAEVYTMLSACLDKIISVTQNIPCIEKFLFPKLQKWKYLLPVSRNEKMILKMIDDILNCVTLNAAGPELYLHIYNDLSFVINGSAKEELQQYFSADLQLSLQDFKQKINDYDNLLKSVSMLRNKVMLNMVELDCSYINRAIRNIIEEMRVRICNHFVSELRNNNLHLCQTFDEIATKVSGMPETTVEVVNLYNYLCESRDVTMYHLKNKLSRSSEILLFLFDLCILSTEELHLTTRTFTWPKEMENVMILANNRLNVRKEYVESILKKQRENCEREIQELQKSIEQLKKKDVPLLTINEIELFVNEIEKLTRRMNIINVNSEQINDEEKLLDLELTPYSVLNSMNSTLETFHLLWTTVFNFHKNYDKWFYNPFHEIGYHQVKEQTENTWITLNTVSKLLTDVVGARRVADIVKSKVHKFKQYIPILEVVCNPGLRRRHWEEISEIVNVDVKTLTSSNLAEMINFGFPAHLEKLREICSAATKEFDLEQNLHKMQDSWRDIHFQLQPYRESNIYILSSVDDIQVLLDDHILKVQTMRSSHFAKALEQEMQSMEEKLILIQDIIDQWLLCQASWLNLEAIFTTEDIIRQMPTESENFQKIDSIWRTIMTRIKKDTRVMNTTNSLDILDQFRTCNTLLDGIQKNLNNYLEKKRSSFPRFYFLSDKELLALLSETKDPRKIQFHLEKCFEGISKLCFKTDEEIIGILSAEGECIPFSGKIHLADMKGKAEKWLLQVEEQMRASLRDIAQESIETYIESSREEWLLFWPAQIAICVSQIYWTSEVVESLKNNTISNYLSKCNCQIQKISNLIRGKLDPKSRITLNAVMITEIHARDVLVQLLEKNIHSAVDFNWISQMRYYWLGGTIVLSMFTTNITYGFEYLGNKPRLVITPLTERCYQTFMNALKLNLSGALQGSSGTGKTETIKDLARTVAKQCIPFRFSSDIHYKIVGVFLKGIVQSGAWSCFDDFDKINVEVLSVVAQKILAIKRAISMSIERFIFEGTDVKLNSTCGIFLTMGSGYVQRNELPVNLKSLFRTVSVVSPDYHAIIEVTLSAFGFLNAKNLATKVTQIYELCSKQFNTELNYNFSLQSVKAFLVTAENLKLKNISEDENSIILSSILKVNMPQFVDHDVEIFKNICNSVFPLTDVRKNEYQELEDWIKRYMEKRNLYISSEIVEKTVQLYETILVKQGIIITGESFSGKTQTYQTLANVLGDINRNKRKEYDNSVVSYRIINPKAVTVEQLYGRFDAVSCEWTDGILTNIFREFVQPFSTDRKWLILDGPVDVSWADNLNSVLDNNKKLCLASGEVIRMSNKMNIIFETTELLHASPAVISRCGVIYIQQSALSWIGLFQQLKNNIRQKMSEEQVNLVDDLVQWLTEPIFEFVKNHCKSFIKVSERHMFLWFTKILYSMFEQEKVVSTVWLQCILFVSVIWGMCSTLDSDSKKNFDTFFRNLLEGNVQKYPRPKSFKLSNHQLFPDKSTVFDWVYDKRNNGSWITWIETVAPILSSSAYGKQDEMIVQTHDMSIQIFFMKNFLSASTPILFVGPTGAGKSTIVKTYFKHFLNDKFTYNLVNCSACTTASQMQESIVRKLDRRRKAVYGPAMGKQCIIFVDDLNMPQKDVYGSQPPLELLRQLVEYDSLYDAKERTMFRLVDILFIYALSTTGSNSEVITPRLSRHMHIIGIDIYDNAILKKIYGTVLERHFAKQFDTSIAALSKVITTATTDLFFEIVTHFFPTPKKIHYNFNLRDFSNVVNGIMLVPAARLKVPDKLKRLWVHEVFRVFHDRLVDNNDREHFLSIVKTVYESNFQQTLETVLSHLLNENQSNIELSHMRDLLFGNYMESTSGLKVYDEILSPNSIQEKMEYYLAEYNVVAKLPMNLILFKYSIEHISRIARLIGQKNGHAILVGVEGLGRNSCAKLATSMCEYDMLQINSITSHDQKEWQKSIKHLLLQTGKHGKSTVFLISDKQIKSESILEDMNIILNCNDSLHLYGNEERAKIMEHMRCVIQESSDSELEITSSALSEMFLNRINEHLHLILTMSPLNSAYRNRLRMFPFLLKFCTIDWYTPWPKDALEQVVRVSLKDLNADCALKEKCTTACELLHTSVQKFIEHKNPINCQEYCVTSLSFLHLIQHFKKLFTERYEQITMKQKRYKQGLEKLDYAASQVVVMQKELYSLQPKLLVQSQLRDKLMIKIEQDTINVEAKKEVVAADEALANEAAAAAQAIKDDCESDLAEATPALEAALASLDTLKPSDITIVKAMKSPPAGVRLVMESVCVLKGVKPEKVQDPVSGQIVDDFWPASTKLLGDMKFLESLKTFDKDNIPPPNIKRIRDKYMNDRSFQPENIKKISTACEGLCKWVRAIEIYDRVIKVVAPKKAMLAEAEAALSAQMETLNEKRSLLQEVTDKLQQLNDELAECMREKKNLEDQIDFCTQKLDRAEKLLGGLGGEKVKWSEIVLNLQKDFLNIIGDVLLASGAIAYLGPFTSAYRKQLNNEWKTICETVDIPYSKDFNLVSTLGDYVDLKSLLIHGLSADDYSIENAIIVKCTNRWPLMIDPQSQANKWIKNMENKNELCVLKINDKNILENIGKAIELGRPVLLENVLETIDDIFESIFRKNIYKQGENYYTQLGENVIQYNENFRLYMTTHLQKPRYSPEIIAHTTLINFTITFRGLNDMLRDIVVTNDLPTIKEKKNLILLESANNHRVLKEAEDKILEVLSSSEGNILEDEIAIKILTSSKLIYEDIQTKEKAALKTTKEIDDVCSDYKTVSNHGAILYSCIMQMANIQSVYQFSLPWFIKLYETAIISSEPSTVLKDRLNKLICNFSQNIYRNICQSLFEKDKLIFSFILTIGVLREAGKIEENLLTFFTSQISEVKSNEINPVTWLPDEIWFEIVRASALPGLNDFKLNVLENQEQWRKYYTAADPLTTLLPTPFSEESNNLKTLIIVRCLRPDKLKEAVKNFISCNATCYSLQDEMFNTQEFYKKSINTTPLILILAQGLDPTNEIMRVARINEIPFEKLSLMSLGYYQFRVIERTIQESANTGKWVVLQNCHLAKPMMSHLEYLYNELILSKEVHSNFRLWLTSIPFDEFPVSLLKNSIKMIMKKPNGLKGNLLGTYVNGSLSNTKLFEKYKERPQWSEMLFALCFLHVVINERSKYGSAGWTIPYYFNTCDLMKNVLQLEILYDCFDDVPLDIFSYLINKCSYGCAMEDKNDHRLMDCFTEHYLRPDILSHKIIEFSSNEFCYMPLDFSYSGIVDYIENLPLFSEPTLLGLSENVEIVTNQRETLEFLSGVRRTQTVKWGNDINIEESVFGKISNILTKIPPCFDIPWTPQNSCDLEDSFLNTVLCQELWRYNKLLQMINNTLLDVQKAVCGQAVMTAELQRICTNVKKDTIPHSWAKVSYPSLKPLGSYIDDLVARISFFQDWIQNDAPINFWISAFFSIQSLLAGELIMHARKHHVPIETLDYEFEITSHEEKADCRPFCGKYLYGLFLEGARWDRNAKVLDESQFKMTIDKLPTVWLKINIKKDFLGNHIYCCPVYMTKVRGNVTNVNSCFPNSVMYILFPTKFDESHWIKRGVACLCQLDD